METWHNESKHRFCLRWMGTVKKKKKSLADKLQPLQTFTTLLLFIVLWQLPWVSFLVAEPSSVVFNTVPTSVCLQGLCLPKDFIAPSHGIRILTYLIKTIFSWDRVSKWPVTCQRSEIGWWANLGSVCFLHWNHKNLFFNTWLTPWVRNLNSDPYTFQVSTLWTEKSFQPSDSFFFFSKNGRLLQVGTGTLGDFGYMQSITNFLPRGSHFVTAGSKAWNEHGFLKMMRKRGW